MLGRGQQAIVALRAYHNCFSGAIVMRANRSHEMANFDMNKVEYLEIIFLQCLSFSFMPSESMARYA